ncbi:hypothetical protein [Actinoplanes nipponensis]|uniref:hypothetical protein n=1 Tax=Actinoplanes nipponensis TaxID=135950 RepID=UPI0031E7BE06
METERRERDTFKALPPAVLRNNAVLTVAATSPADVFALAEKYKRFRRAGVGLGHTPPAPRGTSPASALRAGPSRR